MNKLVTKVCYLMVFLLVVSSPSAAFAKSQSSEEQFKHQNPPSEKANKGMARSIIAHMTMKEKIGQLVMPVTHPQHAIDEMPNDNTRKIVQDYYAGSVIIANKKNPEFMAKYNNQLQEWAGKTQHGIPLIISADLEYGTTHNVVQGTTTFPHQMGIGATRSTKAAKTVASITAEEAKAMGFSWNFSPLADVNTNPKNPVIGVRSFGEKSDLVSRMTSAMVKGYQSEGVITSAKHFPGHGNTEVDSHFGLPTVTYDRETLKEVHLAPFKSAIDAGVDSIMTGHVIIEAIDPTLPATLSKKVLTGVLREEMNFDGIIITDAMSMDAIDERWGSGDAAVMALKAGADIIMATGSHEEQVETFESLYQAVESGELSKKRINDSVERVLMQKLKHDLFENRFVNPKESKEIAAQPEFQEKAAEVARQSITLVKNDSVLPFDKSTEQNIFVAGVTEVDAIASAVQNISEANVTSWQASTHTPREQEIQKAATLAENADKIIVATYSKSGLPDEQAQLVQSLQDTGKPVAAISLGLPYDVAEYPNVDGYLASYAIDKWGSDNPPVLPALKASVEVVFGAQPGGKLPVSIKDQYPYGHGLSYR